MAKTCMMVTNIVALKLTHYTLMVWIRVTKEVTNALSRMMEERSCQKSLILQSVSWS